MRNRMQFVWLVMALTVSAVAQTTVTTTGGTTNTVPVFTGSATIGSSVITQSNGNVGIGTTTPLNLQYNTELSLYGGWYSGVDLGGNGVSNILRLSTDGSGNGYLQTSTGANDNLYLGTWSTTRLAITNRGNIGIGTTSPAYLLDVAGLIRSSSGGMVFPDGSTQTTAYNQVVSGSNSITQSNGNVGIGTSSPVQKLSISHGSIDLDNFGFISSYRAPANNYTNLFLGGSIVDNGNGTFTVQTDGGSNYFAAIRMDSSGGNAGAINFYSAPSISGSTYTLTNAQLASYQNMTIVGGNVGIGTTSPGSKLEVNGNVKLTSGSGASITFADGTVQSTAYTGVTCGGDYAESVDVSGERTHYEPADVLVIDPSSPGKFLKSAEEYSTSVTGIYSTKPGVVGRRQTTPKNAEEVPMAMIGIVPTKVSAENGPIHPGDLLVTSSKLGFAMKGTDRTRMLGAVLGKALGSLDSGTGVIEVVVTLQ